MKTKFTRFLLVLMLLLGAVEYGHAQKVQIVHNSPDPSLDSVDIYVITPFGSYSYQDFKFRQSSAFITLTGGITLQLGVAPGNSKDQSEVFYTQDINLESGKTYVYSLEGLRDTSKFQRSPSGKDLNFKITEKANARGDASTLGNFDFYLLNAVPDDSAKIVALRSNSGEYLLSTDFNYGDTSRYFSLASGTYILDVFRKGSGTLESTYLLDLPSNVSNNVGVLVYSGFADSTKNNNGHSAGWFLELPTGTGLIGKTNKLEKATTASLQIIHNSADPTIEKVDVYSNGTLIADNLPFQTGTATLTMNAGEETTISFAPQNSTSSADAFYSAKTNLVALNRYIMITRGVIKPSDFKANPDGQAIDFGVSLVPGKGLTNAAGNASAKTFHGVTDMSYVDVVDKGVTMFNNGRYNSVTADYVVMPADKNTFEVWDSAQSAKKYAFSMDLKAMHDSAGILLLSGFMDTAANQNGPALSMAYVLPNGKAVTSQDVSAIRELALNTGIGFMAYPNPAVNATRMVYRLDKAASVQINVMDATGKRVMQLQEGKQAAGTHDKVLDVSRLPAGIYVIELQAGSQVAHQRLMLNK